jgi:hypothetical protein
MATKADDDKKREGPSVWLIAAAALTIAYVVWVGWTVTPGKPCGNDAQRLCSFWEQLRALDLNEFGDFLAGVFAPLAFLWLAAAVGIQSQELAAQRKELRLTRREFEQNREVAKAQAEEARKQAEYIGTQTDILEAQDYRRQQEAADAEFMAILDVLAEKVGHDIPKIVHARLHDGSRKTFRVYADGKTDFKVLRLAEAYHDMLDLLYRDETGIISISIAKEAHAGVLLELEQMNALRDRVTDERRRFLDRLQPEKFIQNVQEVARRARYAQR